MTTEQLIAKIKYLSNTDHCFSAEDMQRNLESIHSLLQEQFSTIEEQTDETEQERQTRLMMSYRGFN
jgi:SOS response regulatory protein OraA/RecX